MTEDRVLNSEWGMRNAEKKRGRSFEFGIGNAECGKEKRGQRFELGIWNAESSIWDLGFRIADFNKVRNLI